MAVDFIFVNPIKNTIPSKVFNTCFGKNPVLSSTDAVKSAAKMALIGVYATLDKGFPEVCNMKEVFMTDHNMTEDEYTNFFNIRNTNDLKEEYFTNLLDNIKSLEDEYDFLKKNTKVNCNEDDLCKYEKLIRRYSSVFHNDESSETEVKKTSKKIGRPKLSDDKKRKNKVIMYVTDEEYEELKKLAKGKEVSVYIRDIVLK